MSCHDAQRRWTLRLCSRTRALTHLTVAGPARAHAHGSWIAAGLECAPQAGGRRRLPASASQGRTTGRPPPPRQEGALPVPPHAWHPGRHGHGLSSRSLPLRRPRQVKPAHLSRPGAAPRLQGHARARLRHRPAPALGPGRSRVPRAVSPRIDRRQRAIGAPSDWPWPPPEREIGRRTHAPTHSHALSASARHLPPPPRLPPRRYTRARRLQGQAAGLAGAAAALSANAAADRFAPAAPSATRSAR